VAIIELQGIGRSYLVAGTELKVLRDVSLSIEAGDFVAIVGPSGSGKSTLMQILGLLDRPTYGTYKLLGLDVSSLSDDEGAALRSRTIGFIFQMFNLLARTSARDNVALPMIYSGLPDRDARAAELLNDVGLGDRMDHAPNQLSGGQQQRVAVARALVNRPRILFADEPTGNLASDQAEDILRRLQQLNDQGITVILVTHDPEIAAHAKRVIRIKDGQVVADERSAPLPSAGNMPAILGEEAIQPPRLSFSEIKEFASSALRAILANKVRSLLSMLGILIGVAAVIAMLAIGKGAQKAVEARLSGMGANLLMIQPGGRNFGGVRGMAGQFNILSVDDLKALSHASPNIVYVDGNVSGNVQAVYRDQNTNTQVTGALPVYAQMRNAQPYYGRFFTEAENANQARVALLGQTVVATLFKNENPLGQMIKLDRIGFQVIGVLPAKGSSGFRDQDDMILIPLNTAMRRVLGRTFLSQIFIQAASPETIPEVMDAATEVLRRRHASGANNEDPFQIRNMADIQATLQSTTQTFSLLLGIVAAISLLVGGIGIMNIMLVSVSERTREIGLRKAVGAARRAILIQFLLEAAVLSTLGGILGIGLGGAISVILTQFAGWSAEVTPQATALAFFFSVGIGVLFGFWPATKASRLSPIEALRYE
jgi:macrolide transport system ATP-binding/permease protein